MSVPTLNMEREFAANIERVFAAWTQAELLAQWFGPEGVKVEQASIELRVGGAYKIVLSQADGPNIAHWGEYVEINKPKSLIFTWRIAQQACSGSEDDCADTLVSLRFSETVKGTLLQLTHEKLPSQKAFDGHHFGWQASLDTLADFLGG
jgi:uncharacterized protein YndB with AHSA1/START domain